MLKERISKVSVMFWKKRRRSAKSLKTPKGSAFYPEAESYDKGSAQGKKLLQKVSETLFFMQNQL